VQKISNEDFSDRIEDSSKDELGDITRALNLMSERIANSVEKLKEKDLLRGTMLRSLAHDLRTPLTSIRGFNELLHLQGPQLPAEDREDYYQLIFSRVDMIDNMVQGLHLLSRLEAEDAKPDLLPLSVKELFERLERSYQLTSSDHSIKISFTLNHGVEGVVADQFMLERVLNNLIDNAIRHTTKNGQIEVSATPVGNLVEFTVKDSGCGIAEDEIELIFEQFYRATNSQKSTTAGTGLGLYIVRRILALHNSLIKVKSALGKGTSFSFSLDGYSAKTI
jgi:signal transduction histidine kinase